MIARHVVGGFRAVHDGLLFAQVQVTQLVRALVQADHHDGFRRLDPRAQRVGLACGVERFNRLDLVVVHTFGNIGHERGRAFRIPVREAGRDRDLQRRQGRGKPIEIGLNRRPIARRVLTPVHLHQREPQGLAERPPVANPAVRDVAVENLEVAVELLAGGFLDQLAGRRILEGRRERLGDVPERAVQSGRVGLGLFHARDGFPGSRPDG